MNIRTLSATAVAGAALATITVAPALATGSQTGKVTICHVEDGKAVTQRVSVAALHGHKHHVDDYLGACKPEPTPAPTPEPEPTTEPTSEPTTVPTTEPTVAPSTEPTTVPTTEPTEDPTTAPIEEPTTEPTVDPITEPTTEPTTAPTTTPTAVMPPPVIVIPVERREPPATPAPGEGLECADNADETAKAGTPGSWGATYCGSTRDDEPQTSSQRATASDDVLANTGGAERAWSIAGVLALATGGVLFVARRWVR